MILPVATPLQPSPAGDVRRRVPPRKPRAQRKRGVPDGLWMRCEGCQAPVFVKSVYRNLGVCLECGHHFYLGARDRLAQLLDPSSFIEWFSELRTADPLGFRDLKPYRQRLREDSLRTRLLEAAVVGQGAIGGRKVAIGVTDSGFMMGSMGCVVGEKLARTVELADRLGLPLVLVSGSGGGARMQESTLSLMQMGKVCAALGRFHQARGLYIAVLTDPTMGGAAASFAFLGDVILAEPGARIGFAGPRVVEATIKQKLPDGFQTAEFLLQHGFIDRIVARKDLPLEIGRIMEYCGWGPDEAAVTT